MRPSVRVFCSLSIQRRQSGLKSEGRGSGLNKIDFSRQISEKFQFQKKNRFFQANFRQISAFSGHFTKSSIFKAKIRHLLLLLGKLFYFSSKVTTFEHTSCT